ncbi:hypothetical protein NQZ68_033313 [Dissostichus eleginoides]|nr:hypothetical protein NQZ68_033313 [Dissostichus eleginoides]
MGIFSERRGPTPVPRRSACGAGVFACLMVGGECSREGRIEGPKEKERERGMDLYCGPPDNSGLRLGSQTELLRRENSQQGREEGRVQPTQLETRYHGKDKQRGAMMLEKLITLHTHTSGHTPSIETRLPLHQ